MADKWNLVCVDCLAILFIGKPAWIDEAGGKVDPHFWIAPRAGTHGGMMRSVEQFLGLHLGHVLGTVAEDFINAELEPWDPDAEPVIRVRADDLDVASWPIIEEPSATTAAQHLRERLRAILKTPT